MKIRDIGMKVGMLAIWDSWGVRHPVTVIHLDDVRVLQVKREAIAFCWNKPGEL